MSPTEDQGHHRSRQISHVYSLFLHPLQTDMINTAVKLDPDRDINTKAQSFKETVILHLHFCFTD